MTVAAADPGQGGWRWRRFLEDALKFLLMIITRYGRSLCETLIFLGSFQDSADIHLSHESTLNLLPRRLGAWVGVATAGLKG
jgi:hypothetical protein